ncbi:MAG: hypothetical protein WCW56_00980 [Candidatus Paceibacterota bacterium]|jgi:hypothetical protein
MVKKVELADMDPEIQPLANKVNKIEQKLEEQEQRIDLLEHEEAAMEQKLAMEEIINPSETILTDAGDSEPLEKVSAKETEPLAIIEHSPETFWSRWSTKESLSKIGAVISAVIFLLPFAFGLNGGSLFTPTLILLIDLAIVALTIFTGWTKLPIIGIVGTVIVYLSWFFSTGAGVVNPDLLTSFWFVAGYFIVLTSALAIRIGWQKKKLESHDLWLVAVNSFLLFTAIFFLFRDTFVGALSFFAIILLLGNGALIGYYFYNKKLPLKVSPEADDETLA